MFLDENGVIIRESNKDDSAKLAPNLRSSDVKEIWAAGHLLPLESLESSFKISRRCFTIEHQGQVVAMFGCAPITSDQGTVWLLASDGLYQMRKTFFKYSVYFIDLMLEEFPYLFNFVHNENKQSIKWLKLCGASIRQPEALGPDGGLFCYFDIRRKNYV